MLKCRVRSDRQPRTKNGQPAQSTTGVERMNCVQRDTSPMTQCGASGSMCAIASRKTGSVSAAPIQKRRVMSRSSPSSSLGSGADGLRFERHAALRAIAGMILLDLRVHRAGVDRFRVPTSTRGCVPAPCRTWGNRPACPTPRRGTSGRSISPPRMASRRRDDGARGVRAAAAGLSFGLGLGDQRRCLAAAA